MDYMNPNSLHRGEILILLLNESYFNQNLFELHILLIKAGRHGGREKTDQKGKGNGEKHTE